MKYLAVILIALPLLASAQLGFVDQSGAAVGVADWRTSLVGYWPLDSLNQGKAVDYSPSNLFSYLTNANGRVNLPVQTAGVVNNGTMFTNYSAIKIGTVSPKCVSFWIFLLPNGNNYQAVIGTGSTPCLFISGSSSQQKISYYTTTDNFGFSPPTNVWTHVVAQIQGSGIYYYSNSVFANSSSNSVGTSFTFNYIGSRTDGVSQSLVSKLDEVRLYNRALTSNEISAIYRWGWGTHANTPNHP